MCRHRFACRVWLFSFTNISPNRSSRIGTDTPTTCPCIYMLYRVQYTGYGAHGTSSTKKQAAHSSWRYSRSRAKPKLYQGSSHQRRTSSHSSPLRAVLLLFLPIVRMKCAACDDVASCTKMRVWKLTILVPAVWSGPQKTAASPPMSANALAISRAGSKAVSRRCGATARG